MINQIRTGIIGVGNMGQHHARILAMLPGSQFVGNADASKERPGNCQPL
jgi:predicted dehydrogenase